MQVALALVFISGGAYEVFMFEEFSKVPAMNTSPSARPFWPHTDAEVQMDSAPGSKGIVMG